MGEVEQRGDPAVERLQRAHVVAGVDVLGPEGARDLEPHAAEVVEQRPVRADAAHRRLPGVAVRVHEAGQDQRSRPRRPPARRRPRPIGPIARDAAVLDHDVRALEPALPGIADQHLPTAHHQPHARQYLRSRCFPTWPPGTPAILCVAGPHAIPVSSYVRAGDDRIVVALGSRRETLARLRADPDGRLLRAREGRRVHRPLPRRGRAGVDGRGAGQHGRRAARRARAGPPRGRPHRDPRRSALALDRRGGGGAAAADPGGARRPRSSRCFTMRSIGTRARSATAGGTLTSCFMSRSESRSFGSVIIFM